MKLGIGTAQLGMAYGVHGRGRVSDADAHAILNAAAEAGIDTLDTAAEYGVSERVIGSFAKRGGFRVVTKTPRVKSNAPVSIVNDSLRRSLKDLCSARVYGFLIHHVADLLQPGGEEVWQALIELREQGMVSRIGVSVYSPDEIDAVCKRFQPELVQLPLSLLDQRFLDSGAISRLKRDGAEIHIRSVFLQGLLTMGAEERPAWTSRWRDVFSRLDHWISATGLSATEACLQFALQQVDVDRVIVGVDTREQLQELIGYAVCEDPLVGTENLACRDEDLVLPYRWPA